MSLSPETVSKEITRVIASKLIDGHVCHYKRCTIENLPVQIHKLHDKYYIVCPFIRPVPGLSSETLHEKIYSIYICKDTGKIHHCHANCDGERISNVHDCQVCCISGLQYESETVRSWEDNGRCVVSVSCDKSDPLKFSRHENGRVRSCGSFNVKRTQCVLTASTIITTLLFSKKRYDAEWNKYNDMVRDAEKAVNKYRRVREKAHKVKYHIHMASIWYRSMKRRQIDSDLIHRDKEEQEKIITRYTNELLAYQMLVLHHTVIGKASPSLFTFKTFAPACLYIMKNGLEMNGIYIIRRSHYLDGALPEANTLDLYDIHKPTFTACKNNIFKAIRESIEMGLQTPESLEQCVYKCKEILDK